MYIRIRIPLVLILRTYKSLYFYFLQEQHGSTSEILLSDSEINSGLSKVIAHLESSSRKCRSLRNKFLPYSFIWEDDVIASFNLFLKGRYSLQNKNLNRPQTVRASARSTQGRYVLMLYVTRTTVYFPKFL